MRAAAGNPSQRPPNSRPSAGAAGGHRGALPHPSHLQEQQQGENRVKSMLFHMSGEGALLTTC
eukprot:COSAG01_NODE_46339_length_400_cov_313.083056_1_plen_62_part_01